jgi:transposase
MGKDTTYVGLDAHKVAIRVAALLPGETRPIEWQVANEKAAVLKMWRKLQRLAPGEIRLCYEAGPCGYALQRWLKEGGAMCVLVAPSLIPRKPGERIKTDRRDALKLAELLRAGLLTEVHPPSEDDEAARDLCRARDDAQQDLVRSRHRLAKLLLRRGHVWGRGRKAWTQVYDRWLLSLRFERPADQAVFDNYLLAIGQAEERLRDLDARIKALSLESPYAESVAALRCFRGIDTISAMTIVTELHGFMRFTSPRGLMAFLGLVPSEHSSGDQRHQGAITKAGNAHVRRILIEAAWHYRHRPGVKSLRKRREGQPAHTIAIADRAMQRLYRRFTQMQARHKPTPKAVVAVARELVGFIWMALQPKTA